MFSIVITHLLQILKRINTRLAKLVPKYIQRIQESELVRIK